MVISCGFSLHFGKSDCLIPFHFSLLFPVPNEDLVNSKQFNVLIDIYFHCHTFHRESLIQIDYLLISLAISLQFRIPPPLTLSIMFSRAMLRRRLLSLPFSILDFSEISLVESLL